MKLFSWYQNVQNFSTYIVIQKRIKKKKKKKQIKVFSWYQNVQNLSTYIVIQKKEYIYFEVLPTHNLEAFDSFEMHLHNLYVSNEKI